MVGKSNPERKCSPPRLFLQVRAGRRKCVSSAALCTQRYRTHRQGETGWREREGVWYREGEREWEVPDSEREGEGRVIYVLRCYSLIQSQGRTRSVRAEQSSRGIECKCAAGLKSKQKAWRESGDDKVISSERNEHKCMIMLKRRL